jgi:hypothetical protein
MSFPSIDERGWGLQPHALTLEQKMWIGAKINTGTISGWSFHRNTSIGFRSVYRYARKLKSGGVIRESGGRPPAIDNEGCNNVVHFILQNPTADKDEIVTIIKENYVLSFHRKYSGGIAVKDGQNILVPRLSRRSIGRFVTRFQQMALTYEAPIQI